MDLTAISGALFENSLSLYAVIVWPHFNSLWSCSSMRETRAQIFNRKHRRLWIFYYWHDRYNTKFSKSNFRRMNSTYTLPSLLWGYMQIAAGIDDWEVLKYPEGIFWNIVSLQIFRGILRHFRRFRGVIGKSLPPEAADTMDWKA